MTYLVRVEGGADFFYRDLGHHHKAGVRKRYTEFVSLRRQLVARFGREGLLIPPLPPKYSGTQDSEFVKRRMSGLALFLEALAASPFLAFDSSVKHFLTTTTEENGTIGGGGGGGGGSLDLDEEALLDGSAGGSIGGSETNRGYQEWQEHLAGFANPAQADVQLAQIRNELEVAERGLREAVAASKGLGDGLARFASALQGFSQALHVAAEGEQSIVSLNDEGGGGVEDEGEGGSGDPPSVPALVNKTAALYSGGFLESRRRASDRLPTTHITSLRPTDQPPHSLPQSPSRHQTNHSHQPRVRGGAGPAGPPLHRNPRVRTRRPPRSDRTPPRPRGAVGRPAQAPAATARATAPRGPGAGGGAGPPAGAGRERGGVLLQVHQGPPPRLRPGGRRRPRAQPPPGLCAPRRRHHGRGQRALLRLARLPRPARVDPAGGGGRDQRRGGRPGDAPFPAITPLPPAASGKQPARGKTAAAAAAAAAGASAAVSSSMSALAAAKVVKPGSFLAEPAPIPRNEENGSGGGGKNGVFSSVVLAPPSASAKPLPAPPPTAAATSKVTTSKATTVSASAGKAKAPWDSDDEADDVFTPVAKEGRRRGGDEEG